MSREGFRRAVGDALGVKAWTLPAVSHAESGKRAFTASEIAAVARVLDVLPGALFLIPLDVDAVMIGRNDEPTLREDVQRLGARLDPDSPMEYVTEIGRAVGLWRDQAGEIATDLQLLALKIAEQTERVQRLVGDADDIESLAMTARVQMLRYVQGSTPEIEITED